MNEETSKAMDRREALVVFARRSTCPSCGAASIYITSQQSPAKWRCRDCRAFWLQEIDGKPTKIKHSTDLRKLRIIVEVEAYPETREVDFKRSVSLALGRYLANAGQFKPSTLRVLMGSKFLASEKVKLYSAE